MSFDKKPMVRLKAEGRNGYIWTVSNVEGGIVELFRYPKFTREKEFARAPEEDVVYVCGEFVSDGRMGGHTCGKPIKEGNLCGVHAAGLRRRKQNEQARTDKSAQAAQLRKQYETELAELGVNGSVNTVWSTDLVAVPTGGITVSIAELRRILGK